jgi:hypothetical protein
MSQAFVREQENEWLGDVPPNINDLVRFLSRESSSRVTEVRKYFSDKHVRDVHEMSNGFTYALDDDGRWQIVA